MSPKAPDPNLRTSLIDTAAKLLLEHGPHALTTRRLAAEVGTSTMAVYTYFKGMTELRHAVAREGFDRLARYLGEVARTDDTVADLGVLGGAYCQNAFVNPHLYRLMFERPPGSDPDVGIDTFERLVEGVDRAIQAGRFDPANPWELATQVWAMTHGIVMLQLSGKFALDDALRTLEAGALNLFVAFGDDRDAARRSFEVARQRIGELLGPDLEAWLEAARDDSGSRWRRLEEQAAGRAAASAAPRGST